MPSVNAGTCGGLAQAYGLRCRPWPISDRRDIGCRRNRNDTSAAAMVAGMFAAAVALTFILDLVKVPIFARLRIP